MEREVHPDWGADFFRRTLDEADIAVLVMSHAYEVIYANRFLAERIAGVSQSAMIGMQLAREKTMPDEEMERVVAHTRRVLELGVAERIENWALHKDGSRRLMYWSSVPSFDAEGKIRHLVAVGMDVTEQRREMHQLENLAHRDVLTGLYNRTFFERRLPEDMARARLEGVGLALLYIDLDSFKPVNDLHGHEAGDAVLREVAIRLRKGLRQNDIVCRIGGDEFSVILYGISSRDDVGMIVAPMIERLSHSYDVKGYCFDLGASIGIAFLDDAQNSQELLSKADAAMYRAKQAGKRRFAFAE